MGVGVQGMGGVDTYVLTNRQRRTVSLVSGYSPEVLLYLVNLRLDSSRRKGINVPESGLYVDPSPTYFPVSALT